MSEDMEKQTRYKTTDLLLLFIFIYFTKFKNFLYLSLVLTLIFITSIVVSSVLFFVFKKKSISIQYCDLNEKDIFLFDQREYELVCGDTYNYRVNGVKKYN